MPRPPVAPGSFLLGSVPDLRKGVLPLLERLFPEHGDVVRLRLGPPGLRRELTFTFHPEATHRILAGNAAKFSPAGSTISVRIERLPATLRLSVTDQGTGVAPEQREHIFERFHQARGERCVGGLGLGLYVARQIVQLHGGTIRVEESEHPGARFVIDLPARDESRGVH